MPAKEKSGFRKITEKLILSLNILFIIVLLIAYTAPYINPATFSLIAFAGLSYPVILAVNIAFVIFWLFVNRKYAILPAISIFAGWSHLCGLVEFNNSGEPKPGEKKIKVLTYNIQNLVKESTISTKHIRDFSNQSKIVNFIKNQNPGIVCLQELLYDRKGYEKFAQNLGEKIGCPFYYTKNYYPRNDSKKLDAIAIFSKYKILNSGFIKFHTKTIGIFSDIITPIDTIRVFNLHLASLHFKEDDYKFIARLNINENKEELKERSGKILQKINNAFKKRGLQTGIITETLKSSPFPIIVCGDFNDTPFSYTYREISKNLTDSFIQSGKGFSNTYAGEIFPVLRIDYILHDTTFISKNYQKIEVELSDHYPVSCYISKK